jgi:hypothetical protein
MKNALMVLIAIGLAGCAVGNDVQFENSRHTTIGQELIDLKKALDEGIVTAEEFDMLKQDIKASASFDMHDEHIK